MAQLKPLTKILIGVAVVFVALFALSPNLLRSRALHMSHADFIASENQLSDDKFEAGGGGGERVVLRTSAAAEEADIPERKIIRTATFELIADDVPATKGAISKLAESTGGFVESSENSKTRQGLQRGQLTIRVPQSHFDEVRDQIRKLAGRVELDKSDARDVTRDFVDSEARLRNLKATEAQYLAILKNARTVKDTVDVTEKLSDVRGAIEQLTGELKYLSQQVEMSVITVSLRTDADVAQADVKWRPGNQAKSSWHDLKQGLADFADVVISIVVLLPLILLWIAVIYGLALLVWKLSKRFRERQKNPQPPASA